MTLAELESSKAQLEAALDDAVATYTQLRQRLVSLQSQPNLGKSSIASLSKLGEQVQSASREVERRRASIAAVDGQMRRAQAEQDSSQLQQLQQSDALLRERLETVRLEIVGELAELADLLRLHAQLAEKKDRVARELSRTTGKDCRYTNYIDCAVLRKPEYQGNLEYVVETIKRLRVVS